MIDLKHPSIQWILKEYGLAESAVKNGKVYLPDDWGREMVSLFDLFINQFIVLEFEEYKNLYQMDFEYDFNDGSSRVAVKIHPSLLNAFEGEDKPTIIYKKDKISGIHEWCYITVIEDEQGITTVKVHDSIGSYNAEVKDMKFLQDADEGKLVKDESESEPDETIATQVLQE